MGGDSGRFSEAEGVHERMEEWKAKRLTRLIAGSVAEVDALQMKASCRLSPAQRFQQGRSMTELANRVGAYRKRHQGGERNLVHPSHRWREVRTMESPEQTSMEFGDFLKLVLAALQAAEVPYMIGGAVAVWAWGEPRTTRDLDVAIDLPLEKIVRLSQELEKRDMLVPAEVILDLWRERRADLPVNAIHLYTGYKAELFLVRPGEEFRQSAMARRRRVDLGPPLGEVYVTSPEDLILFKLHYFSLSEQPKHTRDIASILLAQGDQLDIGYIESWAARQGLAELWNQVRALAAAKREA